jgi:ribosomal protein L7/L12
MQIVECSACGSKDLVQQNGMLICVYCHSRHLPDVNIGQAYEALQNKSGLEVVLDSAGAQIIAVIKEVRALTNLGLREAKNLVEGAPQSILSDATIEDANKAKETLERLGAKVSIR